MCVVENPGSGICVEELSGATDREPRDPDERRDVSPRAADDSPWRRRIKLIISQAAWLAADASANPPVSAPPPEDVSRRHYSARRLLFDTRGDFIETLYWRLFKRPPDPPGYAYFSEKLRRERNPLRVLSELARSNEARERGTRVRKWRTGALLYLLHATIHGKDRSPAMQTGRSHLYQPPPARGIAAASPPSRLAGRAPITDRLLAQYAAQKSGCGRSPDRRSAALYEAALAIIDETFGSRGAAGADRFALDGSSRAAQSLPIVIDVGGGLGSWLDVLAREGIAALGIEANATAVGYCRRKGHHVVFADPLAHLAAAPPSAALCVTAYELDRRVELGRIGEFFDAVGRVLAPGGLLLATFAEKSSDVPSAFPLPQSFFHRREFIFYIAAEAGFTAIDPTGPPHAAAPIELLVFRKRGP